MNKFKKLAIAAVSVAMAGTMALSVTACGGGNGGGNGGGGGGMSTEIKDHYGVLKDDGSIDYSVYQNRGKVGLNVAIGYDKKETSISYLDLGQEITLPDGVKYSKTENSIKPTWVQLGKDLNIEWTDVWDGTGTAKNLNSLRTNNIYATTDIFTTDLSAAVEGANGGASILNLAKYLDRMPNLHRFLRENPVVYLSLLQDGMNTTTGANQEILVAPYFDGYDDIERYCIVRHDWAKKLLNGSTEGTSTTYASQCKEVKIDAFMGNTDYTVDALNANGVGTQKITKKYSAALAAAKSEATDLGKAYKAIANAVYGGTSGNIVDIMNAAVTANANATGAQLLNLFRAYIDVAVVKADGTAAYSAENRANLFIGYDASWDVDDLVAILRCIKTNPGLLVAGSTKVGGIAPREGGNDRTPALVMLACQLYGIRGGASRNEYTYIANDGTLHDARTEVEFYQAMEKMYNLFQENLLADYSALSGFKTDCGVGVDTTKGNEYFMVYDYSQTQTYYGFYSENNLMGKEIPDGYYFSPVITPVSKWDVDGNKTISADEYFRFTESWRSTKTGGLAVNGAVEKSEAKLDAALQFIDYLYSEDGQILSTFGPMANGSGKDATGGFWYNEKATDAQVAAGEYFTYKGVKYAGTEYKEKYTPTITQGLYESFMGKTVHGWKLGGNLSSTMLSFTGYARILMGSTLPLGVKDQSFENQLTSKMGKAGADVVGKALKADVIKGMSLEVDSNNWWFTCVPTGLPLMDAVQETIGTSAHNLFQEMTGTVSASGSKANTMSIMNWMMLHGVSGSYNYQTVNVSYTSIENLLEQVLSGTQTVAQLAQQRQIANNSGWTTAKSYWTYLSSIK